MQEQPVYPESSNRTFTQKVFIAASVLSLFVIVLLLLAKAFNVVLLVLGGVLIATWFRGMAYWLADKTRLSGNWSLAAVIGGTVMLLTLVLWLLGAKISSQVSQLQQQLPSSVQQLKQKAAGYKWGSEVVSRMEKMQQNPEARKKLTSGIKKFFAGTIGVFGDVYVMLFIAIFFTATPRLYIQGFLRLIPPSKRSKAEGVLKRLGRTLRSWLIGKVLAMIIVAILTAIALYIIGIPFWLVLAIFAGLLNFIPNFGPIIAMAPAVLIGFTQGASTALIIAGVYVVIQIVESNFITPLIQKQLIQIPPALIIIAQIFFGVVTGALGVILATPIVAIIMVLVKSLYSEPMEERGS